jgi:trans-AT polyketide synthase/acyltransferase/oxidoreductase domain-containing protein
VLDAVQRVREPLRLLTNGGIALASAQMGGDSFGVVPALYPEWLGDRTFGEVHGCRFPYVVGEMARGLATVEMVTAAARAGLLAFYGAAGLSPKHIETAVHQLQAALGPDVTWGSNLIHNVQDAQYEDAVVDTYLRTGVRRVSTSAFMALAPSIVRYAATGLTQGAHGRVQRRNWVFAKVSRPEVAAQFLTPPPAAMLDALVAAGALRREEAQLAARVPVAEDITVEADSGGHTDNRPLASLFPATAALRDQLCAKHGVSVRLGAAGSLGTPASVASAFALGAAYVLTGSINQSAIESGLSDIGRGLLGAAGIADMAMAPAADMFELGVKVQVLRRGTFFAARAQRLYDLYVAHDSLDAIPAIERARLESEIFRAPLAEIWRTTRAHFLDASPAEIERAERDAKHKMALVFRWYLFHGSRWAAEGVADRRGDFQIWCGPAMGAFNSWVAGSFLEPLGHRSVVQIALNLLEGAAALTRAHQLRSFGISVPPEAFSFRPRPLAQS